jgi:hypothetical protein
MPKLNTSMLNTAVVDYSDSVETPIATSTVESSVATIDPSDADTQEFLAESSDDELAGEDTSPDGVPFETEEEKELPEPLVLVRSLVGEDYRLMNDDEVLHGNDLMLFCEYRSTGEQHAGFQPHPFGMFEDFTVANGKEKFASRTNGGLCEFYRLKNDLMEQPEESKPAEPAKPNEASEPTETPEPEWDVAAERKKDESAFIRELKELSVEVATKEAELDELKEQLKVAKAEHNLAVAKLQAFAAAGVKYRTKPTKPAKPTQKPADTKVEPAKTEPANAESTDAPKPATDAPKEEMGKESWRATKTESILEGIERLGKTKRAKLLEHFPTFGHLMDARIEASKEFVPFAKKLPDGIGEGIATELINRMDAAIVPGM